jgi:hydroxypyruvate isomerase
MSWSLRYASHLGYRSPESPLFRATVGNTELEPHIKLAADLGLGGVQFALAITRAAEEQARVAAALAEWNLEAGCMLYAPIEVVRSPLWAQAYRDVHVDIEKRVRAAIRVAHTIQSRYIAVLSGADSQLPKSVQRQNFVDNLTAAAKVAASENVILCLENVAATSLPNMLLAHIEEAHSVVRQINHPAVKLIFDTAHVHATDGNVVEHLERCLEETVLVQLADSPGRMEPGTGAIDFAGVVEVLKRKGYRGLVELEHGWSESTPECESAGVQRLREWDAAT